MSEITIIKNNQQSDYQKMIDEFKSKNQIWYLNQDTENKTNVFWGNFIHPGCVAIAETNVCPITKKYGEKA